MQRIHILITVWVFSISVLVAQVTPEAKVTSEEIQQLQDQITALQEKLDSVLKKVEDSRPGDPLQVQTSGSRTDTASSEQEIQQVPGRGLTEKGLYGSLAAGPPEQRYGRGKDSPNSR